MNSLTDKDFENISKWFLSYQERYSSVDDKNTFDKIQNYIKKISFEDEHKNPNQEFENLNCKKFELYETHHYLEMEINQIQTRIENLKKVQKNKEKIVINQEIEDLTNQVNSSQNELKKVERIIEILEENSKIKGDKIE